MPKVVQAIYHAVTKKKKDLGPSTQIHHHKSIFKPLLLRQTFPENSCGAHKYCLS